jgi:Tfp pilus assembly protein PilN
MLTTNLSTRPFYNERAVRAGLIGLLVLMSALTIFSAVSAYSLRSREQSLSAAATQALAEADRLRTETRVMTAQINPKELAAVSAASTEANAVIAQRTFSWTVLLSELERTLPEDVRITAVQPRVEKGRTLVLLDVEAMSADHLAAFMEALEKHGAFRQVLPKSETQDEDNVIDAVLEAVYEPPARNGAAPTSAAQPRTGGRGE